MVGPKGATNTMKQSYLLILTVLLFGSVSEVNSAQSLKSVDLRFEDAQTDINSALKRDPGNEVLLNNLTRVSPN